MKLPDSPHYLLLPRSIFSGNPLRFASLTIVFLSLVLTKSYAKPLQSEQDFYGTNIFFHEWNESNHTRNGYDWSMPNWLEPTSRSAIMHSRKIGGVPAETLLKNAGFRGNLKRQVNWNWKNIEPTEGNYDFQALRNKIDEVSENGKFKIELRIYAAVQRYEAFNDDGSRKDTPQNIIDTEQSAPSWLANKEIPTIVGKKFRNFRLTYYDEYDDRYHNRYLRMINAFRNSGIANDPRIINSYVHLGSQTRGEEGHGPALGTVNRSKYEARIRAWADAFGKDRDKLMITSNESKDLNYAYSLGVGQRNGFVENFLLHVANPSLGTRVDSQGYLEVNENAPLIKNRLASGDENEEYFLTQFMKDRFGDFSTFKHRHQEASLRMLQMRRTSVWSQNTQGFVDPPLTQFVALSLDRDVSTTADAWTYLRQNNLQLNNPNNANVRNQIAVSARNPDGSLPVKNFERWLYQRDGNGVKTIPTRKLGQGGKQLFRDPRHEYDFTARRTDAANGFNKIGLALDDRFAFGQGTDVAIKATYQDNGSNQWYLEYTNDSGNKTRKWVTNGNTGQLKTVTWILTDIAFDAQDMENDFYLVADTGDLTASFVRVVKLKPPRNQPTPQPNPAPSPVNCAINGPDASVVVNDVSGPNIDDGSIVFSFVNNANRTNIEFSLDGGQTYPFNYSDNIGTATIENRAPGTRHIWVRWGNGDCPTDLLRHTIKAQEPDVVQAPWLGKYWRIENVNSGGWLRTQGCSTDNRAAVTQVSKKYTRNCTMYRFEKVDKDYVRIINRVSNSYFMPKSCAEEGDESVGIVQVSPDNAPGWCPQWKLNRDDNANYRLQNRKTGQYMRINRCSDRQDDSQALRQVSTDYSGNCTLWRFVSTGVSVE